MTLRYCIHERVWSSVDGVQWSAYRSPVLAIAGRQLNPGRRAFGWSASLNPVTMIYAHLSTGPCPTRWLPPQRPEFLQGRRVA